MKPRAFASTSSSFVLAARVAAIAIAYFAAGTLALKLAIPQGYASAVWPSAGIALAAALVWGVPTALPGIWLGSFFVNMGSPAQEHLWPSPMIPVVVAMLIAFGAALQALVGSRLVRHALGDSLELCRTRSVLLFVLVGGFMASVVNASIAAFTLLGFGILNESEFLFGWSTWWVGDSIGAVLLAPILVLAERAWRSGSYRRLIVVSLPTLVSLTLVIALFFFATSLDRRRIHDEFARRAHVTVDAIKDRFDLTAEALRSTERLFVSSSEVSPAEFAVFSGRYAAVQWGIRAMAWIPRVPASERSSFEEARRREGGGDFEIRILAPDGQLRRAGAASNYFPIAYIEPLESNERALGFDISSVPARAATLELSARLGEQVATGLVHPVQARRDEMAVVVYQPVYESGLTSHLDGGRLRGFVAGVIDLDRLVNRALQGNRFDFAAVVIRDMSPDSNGKVLFSSSTTRGSSDAEPANRALLRELDWSKRLSLANREWQFEFRPSNAFLSEYRSLQGWVLLAGGLLFSALVGAFLLVSSGHAAELTAWNEELEGRVRERTSRLTEVNSRLEREIAEHSRAQETLRSKQDLLRLFVEHTPAAVAMLDRSMRYIYYSSRWVTDYGLADGNLEGLCHYDVFPDLPERYKEIHRRVLSGEIPFHCAEDRYEGALGEIWIKWELHPWRDETGEIAGLIMFTETITARKETERLLRSATVAKSQFLANMSHEIRTPLTTIIGFTQEVLDGNAALQEQREMLGTVVRNGEHLLGIINDILDLSKIEAGKLETEIVEVDLFGLIDDLDGLMAPRARESGLAFGFEPVFPLPRIVRTDALRVKQILVNLIGNAIKFTKQGGVKVRVTCDEDAGSLAWSVIDTGIGLTEDQRARLFSAFSQGDASTTREFGGTGLGLIISQQLAERLGGSIAVESRPGVGSRFTLTLGSKPWIGEPLVWSASHRTAPVPPPLSSLKDALSGRVLLTEDGIDNQRYLTFLMKKLGLDFAIANNGREALDLMERERFDLVLMDMQMPVMDGYTAARTLRERGCKVPIVALTANILKEDVSRCLEAGCDDFMGKPFDRAAFQAMLARYLTRSATNGAHGTDVFVTPDDDVLPLVLMFLENLPPQIADIGAAVSAGDWASVGEIAHRLRGASLFGLHELSERAADVETAAVSAIQGPAACERAHQSVLRLAAAAERAIARQDEVRTKLSGIASAVQSPH